MKQDNTAARESAKSAPFPLMIRTYCRGHHGTRQGLCPECQALQEYALLRADRCPFIETKTFCSNCRVHCYKPAMREKIRAVMRYSGPRMLFSHPVLVVRHGIEVFVKRNAWREKTMKIKKIVWLLLGLVGLGLGALGAVLPLLPSVPFLMLALFSFGKAPKNCTAGLPAQSSTGIIWNPLYKGRA